jgi:hypothetical protein
MMKKTKVKIDYPTFKIKGQPTPNEKLVICDICGNAAWTIHGLGPSICHCSWNHPSGKQTRMREATPAEYEAGKAALTQIIG